MSASNAHEAPYDLLVLDTETTGLSNADEIVELAVLRVHFDSHRSTLVTVREYHGFREPTCPMNPVAASVHGLSARDLAGKDIDASQVLRLFDGAHGVIAHNASFDRRFVSRLLPGTETLDWYCTQRSINWTDRGVISRRLDDVLDAHGIIRPRSHRAIDDVRALAALLAARDASTNQPYIREVIDAGPVGSSVM